MSAPDRSEHLLPVNATPLERALSASDARMLLAPHNVIRDAWDPDRCPVHLLPYLAQAWSVDEWDPAWSEAEKRQAIRDSIWIHRHKGTTGALRRALAQVRLPVTVSEWFQHGGAPYTFRLRIALDAGVGWAAASLRRLLRIAIATKNVRSWLDEVHVVTPAAPAAVGVGIVARARVRVVNLIDPDPAFTRLMPVHAGIGAVARVRVRIMPL